MKKESKAIEKRIIRDIKNPFELEQEQENYNKLVQVVNFWNNDYMGCKSSGYRNKEISVEEYVNKIKPDLNDILNDLKKSETWKNKLYLFQRQW